MTIQDAFTVAGSAVLCSLALAYVLSGIEAWIVGRRRVW